MVLVSEERRRVNSPSSRGALLRTPSSTGATVGETFGNDKQCENLYFPSLMKEDDMWFVCWATLISTPDVGETEIRC